MPIKTCVFDAYGTLFDVSASARAAAQEPDNEAIGENWQALANHWRDKQLQYTWLRAVTGDHVDFWQVTQDGLDYAMEAVGLSDDRIRQRLLDLYRDIPAYDEVPAVLRALKDAGYSAAILSNGSPDMLSRATTSAGIADLLDDNLSVEAVGIFKPSAKVYDMVSERFGTAKDEVLFVSSNGWDVCSAAAYGFRTAWVNRMGVPMDRLSAKPDEVLADLTPIPDLAGRL